MTDCVIRSRIDPNVKEKAVVLFEQMGLTLNEAIRLFIYQSVAENRMPFSVKFPNAVTRKVLRKIVQGKDLESISLEALKKDWDDAR